MGFNLLKEEFSQLQMLYSDQEEAHPTDWAGLAVVLYLTEGRGMEPVWCTGQCKGFGVRETQVQILP